MTFDQFRYFLETAKFQHIGKAAKSLHISPSAVSTAISALEEEMGALFFERKGQGIQLTEKGRQFRSGVERILDQIGELSQNMSAEGFHLSGNYRLAASHFLSSQFLGRAWSEIQLRYPNISTELNSMSTANIVADVLSGALDAGLCFSPLRHPDLKQIKLLDGQLQLVVRRGHPLAKKWNAENLTLLSQYPAVIHKANEGVDLCEDHPMFEKFGIIPKVKCLWNSDDLAVDIIKRTDSWSLMPDIVCRLNGSSIETLKAPRGWDAPYFIALVLRTHRAENPFVEILEEALISQMDQCSLGPKNKSRR